MRHTLLAFALIIFNITISFAQKDTITEPLDFTFRGTRMAEKEEEFDTTGTLDINGYASFYYAHYTDSLGPSSYQKFPTICPLSDAFSINILQVSAKYTSNKVRGVITMHWGDIPRSAWSPKFNIIQQANLGFKLYKKLWFDAGLFRTHIGLESIQPRENINSSMALTTFFEPYYLAGAKLTWQATKALALQVNSFNSFNGFIETNHKKSLGISSAYEKNKVQITFNSIANDDAPDSSKSQLRWYNNLYLVYKSKHIILGFEANFGAQKNTYLKDSTLKYAMMYGGLIALKYKFNKKFAIYSREEYFSDPNQMLTGPIENGTHKLIGLNTWGASFGIEIKPIPNSYFRLETRRLQDLGNDEDIFYYKGAYHDYRWEFLVSTGVWF